MLTVEVVLRFKAKLVRMHICACDGFSPLWYDFPNLLEIGVGNLPAAVHHDADRGMRKSRGVSHQQKH